MSIKEMKQKAGDEVRYRQNETEDRKMRCVKKGVV